MGGEKCLEYPCIMQSNLLDEEYSAILRYGNLLFARSSVEMFFEHGRQWKENFESLIYFVLCGNRFFESIHISRFAKILPRKLETRFLFRPSLILKNRDWKVPFVESNWWR